MQVHPPSRVEGVLPMVCVNSACPRGTVGIAAAGAFGLCIAVRGAGHRPVSHARLSSNRKSAETLTAATVSTWCADAAGGLPRRSVPVLHATNHSGDAGLVGALTARNTPADDEHDHGQRRRPQNTGWIASLAASEKQPSPSEQAAHDAICAVEDVQQSKFEPNGQATATLQPLNQFSGDLTEPQLRPDLPTPPEAGRARTEATAPQR